MDSEKNAFWGVALKPGEPADLELQDGEVLHMTMISYGVKLADPKGRSVVTARVKNAKTAHALAVLNAGFTESCIMDVSFIGEENVTFEVTGKNVVHLVGNFSFENEEDSDGSDDEGEGLIGVYDDDGEMSDDDDDDDEQGLPKLVEKDPPVITELKDDDEDDRKNKVKALPWKGKEKKEKLANGNEQSAVNHSDAKKGGKAVSFKSQRDKGQQQDEDEEMDDEDSEDDSNGFHPGTKVTMDDDDDSDDDDVGKERPVAQKGGLRAKKPSKKVPGKSKRNVEEEEEDEDEDDEDGITKVVPAVKPADQKLATPQSSKKKRRKKKGNHSHPEEPTPPSSKKAKVSERPGTPAAVKTSSRVPAAAKESKKMQQVNGSPEPKPPMTTPVQNKPTATGDGSQTKSGSKKRKRRRSGNAA